jgi:hypothetical protein
MSSDPKKNTSLQAQPASTGTENPANPLVTVQHGEESRFVSLKGFSALRLAVNAAVHYLKSHGVPEGRSDDDFGRSLFLDRVDTLRNRWYEPDISAGS